MISPLRRIIAAVRVIGSFLKAFFSSSAKLIVITYAKAESVTPGIFFLEIQNAPPAILYVIAHLITMTPGTLSIDVKPAEGIQVHFLDIKDLEGTKEWVYRSILPQLRTLWGLS